VATSTTCAAAFGQPDHHPPPATPRTSSALGRDPSRQNFHSLKFVTVHAFEIDPVNLTVASRPP